MKKISFNEALYTSVTSYKRLAKLHQEIVNINDDHILLELNIEKRTGLTFVFCLSLLPLLAKNKGKELEIVANEKLIKLMSKIGAIEHSDGIIPNKSNIASNLMDKTRIIKTSDDIFKLVPEITKEAPVQMNEKLTEIFTSKIGEMYNNSIEHSGAKYVVGGKYYKYQKNLYCFSCYDTGTGIPQKVMKYMFDSYGKRLKQKEAFKWALERGNSTANSATSIPKIPRGLGLGLLKNFASLNGGAIRICSGKILYVYDKDGEEYYELDNEFIGTLFEMDIVADNKRKYIIK